MALTKKTSPVKNNSPAYLKPVLLFALFLLTWIVYSPLLNNDFLTWDDPVLILENPFIKNLQFASIQHLFTSFYLGNYHPLTMLCFSLEYALFGLSPKGFHAVSLLLHIINTGLVFLVFDRLTGRKLFPALIVAVLFAIHPMHLESVAWATEQKDLVYTLFFLLSIFFYLEYADNRKNKLPYGLSLLFFLFSLLSKGQAVTLPLMLILIDYLSSKKFTWKTIPEKIPFFILAMVFGLIAIYAQHQTAGINEAKVPVTDLIFMNSFAYLTYLFKAFIPLSLSGFHEYPYLQSGGLPVYIYFSPFLILLLIFLAYRYLRTKTAIIFGVLFFTINLLPLLLLPVGKAYMGERFSYIAYLGLFFIIADMAGNAQEYFHQKNGKSYLLAGICLFSLFFAVRTYSRTAVWRDSLTYWNDVSGSYPRSLIACEQKSMYYYYNYGNDSLPQAIMEQEKAISIDSGYAPAYRILGFYYSQAGEQEQAINRLSTGLRLDPGNADLWLYRGNALRAVQQYQRALNDYTSGIAKSPGRTDLWIARGSVYLDNLARYDSAMKDFQQASRIDPSDGIPYLNIALTAYKSNSYDSAISWSDKAIAREKPLAHLIKSLSYYKMKSFAESAKEARLARAAGISVPDSLVR